jgi:hypothetical protein
MAVFWDVAPINLVDIVGRFRELTAFIIRVKMETVISSETSVDIYQTTRCYIREDSHLLLEHSLSTFFHLILFIIICIFEM